MLCHHSMCSPLNLNSLWLQTRPSPVDLREGTDHAFFSLNLRTSNSILWRLAWNFRGNSNTCGILNHSKHGTPLTFPYLTSWLSQTGPFSKKDPGNGSLLHSNWQALKLKKHVAVYSLRKLKLGCEPPKNTSIQQTYIDFDSDLNIPPGTWSWGVSEPRWFISVWSGCSWGVQLNVLDDRWW